MAESYDEDNDQQGPLVLTRIGVDTVQDIARRVTDLFSVIRRSSGDSFAEQRASLQNLLAEITVGFSRLRKLQAILEVKSAGLPNVSIEDALKPTDSAIGDVSNEAKSGSGSDSDSESRKRTETTGWLIAERENLLQQIEVRNRQLRSTIRQLRELLTCIDVVLPLNITE